MLLLRTDKLPAGSSWSHELKFDGFRAEAIKTNGKVYLRSRNDKHFNRRYPSIVKALAPMPDETVIDGEIVALDSDGRPSFNALQNYGSGVAPLLYYVFDILILKGENVMDQPLTRRRELLAKHVLAPLDEPIRESPELDRKPSSSWIGIRVSVSGAIPKIARAFQSPSRCRGREERRDRRGLLRLLQSAPGWLALRSSLDGLLPFAPTGGTPARTLPGCCFVLGRR